MMITGYAAVKGQKVTHNDFLDKNAKLGVGMMEAKKAAEVILYEKSEGAGLVCHEVGSREELDKAIQTFKHTGYLVFEDTSADCYNVVPAKQAYIVQGWFYPVSREVTDE